LTWGKRGSSYLLSTLHPGWTRGQPRRTGPSSRDIDPVYPYRGRRLVQSVYGSAAPSRRGSTNSSASPPRPAHSDSPTEASYERETRTETFQRVRHRRRAADHGDPDTAVVIETRCMFLSEHRTPGSARKTTYGSVPPLIAMIDARAHDQSWIAIVAIGRTAVGSNAGVCSKRSSLVQSPIEPSLSQLQHIE
jgi:hypothetical protein